MSYHREVGLSADQLGEVADILGGGVSDTSSSWSRSRGLVMRSTPSSSSAMWIWAVNKLTDERRDQITAAEQGFVEAWESLRNVVDDAQHERSIAIYRREFAYMPHPVLGTTAWEAPLGERSDAPSEEDPE